MDIFSTSGIANRHCIDLPRCADIPAFASKAKGITGTMTAYRNMSLSQSQIIFVITKNPVIEREHTVKVAMLTVNMMNHLEDRI